MGISQKLVQVHLLVMSVFKNMKKLKLLWMILKRTKAPQILSGDIVAMTFIGKLVSVFVTIYTIFVVAIVTGVVVNYYGQIVEMQRRETAMMFLDKLERLPELSKEDLEDISKRVQKFR